MEIVNVNFRSKTMGNSNENVPINSDDELKELIKDTKKRAQMYPTNVIITISCDEMGYFEQIL